MSAAPADGWSEGQPPGPEAYVALRAACGLGARTVEAAERGLRASLHCVTLREGGAVVAMARIVGDGGCFAQLVDVMVRPDRQGRGLGDEAVRRALGWAEANLPATCLVGLHCVPEMAPFHAARGFRPLAGMVLNVGAAR